MGNEAVAITPHDILRVLFERRERCLSDYDWLYTVVARLRAAVRTAEEQQDKAVVEERKCAPREAEARLPFLRYRISGQDRDRRRYRRA